MPSIFNLFKLVRPRQTIKSEDFNGLQNTLKTSFDSLGDPLLPSAPESHRGVSTPFHVGAPVDDEHAVTKIFVYDNILEIAEPVIALAEAEVALAKAEVALATIEADRALSEANRAQEIVLGDIQPLLDQKIATTTLAFAIALGA